MSDVLKAWNGDLVRKWLESRFAAARLDQAAADKRGYEAQDDYDKAAAEEWVCRALKTQDRTDDQAAFAAQLKELLAQEEYRVTGVHDDRRFDRHVRANLRKLAKMTKANEGFSNTLRYQG
jgi:monoamine oxidase